MNIHKCKPLLVKSSSEIKTISELNISSARSGKSRFRVEASPCLHPKNIKIKQNFGEIMDDLLTKNTYDEWDSSQILNTAKELIKGTLVKDTSSSKCFPDSRKEYSFCRETEASSILNSTVHNLSTNFQPPLKSCIKHAQKLQGSKSVKFLLQNKIGEEIILEKSEHSEPGSEYDSFVLYGI
mmetsp:Transcript_4678/g.4361  ORF Transcript_4678/g.4361 Transcript_4678/m.4361 type:complete len:182 (-) Transcript_4678:77-622(-)